MSATYGGTQDKSFREAVGFIGKSGERAKRIAILDGVIWLTNTKRKNLYSRLLKLKKDKIVVSSLLLKDFIKSI